MRANREFEEKRNKIVEIKEEKAKKWKIVNTQSNSDQFYANLSVLFFYFS